MRRLTAPIWVLAPTAFVAPSFPSTPSAVGLGAYGLAALLDVLVAELFVRKALAKGHRRLAALAGTASQILISAVLAVGGIYAATHGDEQSTVLLTWVLFLITMVRIGERRESLTATGFAVAPLVFAIILIPWLSGLKLAAEMTIFTMVTLAYLIGSRIRLSQGVAAIASLTRQKHEADAQLAAADASLALLKREAAELKMAQRNLLAGLNSDARRPLSALLELTKAFKEDGGAGVRSMDYAGEIHSRCLQMQDFAQDITDLERIQAGTMPFQPNRVDLPKLLSTIQQDCAARFPESHVRLETVASSDMPSLLADPWLLRRMVMTLVANAMRETASDGRVSVTALRLPDGGLGLRVSSSGSGLSEADLERVFNALVAGRPGELGEEQQTGLSIMIVKAFVERHCGSLSIRTRLGAGTQATLNFPPERLISPGSLIRIIEAA